MVGRKKEPKKPRHRHSSRQKKTRPEVLGAGAWFEMLVALQKRLRAPKGCPWDREQTHNTLRTYLIEEAYEVLDALESGDDAKFAEEMGDLLLQIVFHSQIAAEQGRFTVADVSREVHQKMVRRHPHVFGTKRAKDAAEVLRNWEQIKAAERQRGQSGGGAPGKGSAPASLLDGVPRHLPGLLEGYQLTKKAARIGFDWEDTAGVFEKMREETAEVQQAVQATNKQKIEEELGDLLFATVNLARFLKIDPEIALKKANTKFSRRFRKMEQLAMETGRAIEKVPRREMESLWDTAKRGELNSAATHAKRKR
jgi:MazG family protein